MADIAKTSLSRVFTIEGRAGPNNAPTFQSCMKSSGVKQDFGAITKIEVPDPITTASSRPSAPVKGPKVRPPPP